MIDASIGGKTGVDVEAGKNLVGAFHPPNLVVADPDVVATLPGAERAQGMIEAVKHGAIMDDAYFAELDREMPAILDGETTALERAVARSVELKSAVVSEDEREAGRREILNFGHTLGHAIEAVTGYGRFLHGEAVAIGMVCAAEMAEARGVLEVGSRERQRAILESAGLPTACPSDLDVGEIVGAMRLDKKVLGGRVRFIVPTGIGSVDIRDDFSDDDARHAIEATR